MSQFCSISYKSWWIIFLVSQLAILSMIIASLTVPSWVSSRNTLKIWSSSSPGSNEYFEGSIFVGGISLCDQGCSGSYSMLASIWCGAYSQLPPSSQIFAESDYDSVCKMFKDLYFAMLIYSLAEIIALSALIVWFIGVLCYVSSKTCFRLSFFCSACMGAMHAIGIVFYGFLTRLSLNGQCADNPLNGDPPRLCMETGPKIAFVLFCVNPVVVGVYFLVAWDYRKWKHLHPEMGPPTVTVAVPSAIVVPPTDKPESIQVYNNREENEVSFNYERSPIVYPPAVGTEMQDEEFHSVVDNVG